MDSTAIKSAVRRLMRACLQQNVETVEDLRKWSLAPPIHMTANEAGEHEKKCYCLLKVVSLG